MKKPLLIGGGVLVLLATAARMTLTLFVVQPIGAIPEGRTLVMWRGDSLEFIESADAICTRKMGDVSLLCRGMVLGAIGNRADERILMRLPYSETLFHVSTGGAEYDR